MSLLRNPAPKRDAVTCAGFCGLLRTSGFRARPDFGPIPLSQGHYSLHLARFTWVEVRKRSKSPLSKSVSHALTNHTVLSQHWWAVETVPPQGTKNRIDASQQHRLGVPSCRRTGLTVKGTFWNVSSHLVMRPEASQDFD